MRFSTGMIAFRHTVVTPLLVFAISGCGDDWSASTTFVTFNAGLAPGFVDLATERAPTTIDAVISLDSDVLCVQEFWLQDDVSSLQQQAMNALPGQYFLEPQASMSEGGEPACSATEIDPLEDCARSACGSVSPDELADCVLAACAIDFLLTSPGCQTCLGGAIGGTLDEILLTCGSGPGGGVAYGGSFGTGILTTGHIVASDSLVLDATLNRRAVQFARIELVGGTYDVFCTHLTAVFASIPYPREEGSWVEEQATQIDAMREFVDKHSGAENGVVVLGDFNTGPALAGLSGEVPENYEALAAGYSNPYLAKSNPTCTFCADNPLVEGADDDQSVFIDHILLRDVTSEVESTSRVLDARIEIDSAPAAYSDHYGVSVTLAPVEP